MLLTASQMNYTTIKNILFGITWLVLGYFMNATKGAVVKMITAYGSTTTDDYNNFLIFCIALLLSLGMALNKYFDIQRTKRVKHIDLNRRFTNNKWSILLRVRF